MDDLLPGLRDEAAPATLKAAHHPRSQAEQPPAAQPAPGVEVPLHHGDKLVGIGFGRLDHLDRRIGGMAGHRLAEVRPVELDEPHPRERAEPLGEKSEEKRRRAFVVAFPA